MSPNRRVPLTMLALAFAAATPRLASAGNPTMSECLSANEDAIKLRTQHKLKQARDQALVCAESSCPGEVRETCQLRVRDLNAAIPTLVFLAKDGAGQDVVVVRVSMDGVPIGDRLDGTAMAVDPGQHKFTFEVAGQRPVELSLVISEGQKDRREAVTLGAPAAGPSASPVPIATPATPSVATSSSVSGEVTAGEPAAAAGSVGAGQRVAGVVVGAVGVVGLGLGAVFGALAGSDWSSAKSACSGKPVSCTTSPDSPGFQDEGSATTKATISTVGFIAGGALVAGGVIVFLTAPRRSTSDAPASARGVDLAPSVGPGAAGMTIRGRF